MPQASLTRILLIRHGETSRPDLFHGAESDIDLGAHGRTQASQAGPWLKRCGPVALYCSGMRRARETAEIIGQSVALEPVVIPELHERLMGTLSGQDRKDHWHIYEQARAHWMQGDLDATHEGGESYRQIQERACPVLNTLARKHRGSTVIIIAHGVLIKVVLSSLVEGISLADWDNIGIDCVAVNDLNWDGAIWRANALNLAISGIPGSGSPKTDNLPGSW